MEDNLGMSDMAVLEQAIAEPASTTVVADTTTVDDAPDVNASIDAAIAAEGDAKPVDQAAPPVEKPAADAAKPAETAPSDVDLTTDDLTVKGLNERLAKSPEFKALVDRDPELKKQLFYAARRNERASVYDEMFQTPALAKEVKQASDEYFEFKDSYSTSPEEALKHLFVMTIEKDANGEMVRDASGRFVNSGAFDKAMATHRAAFYGQLSQVAQGLGEGNFANTDITSGDLAEAIKIFQAVEAAYGFGAPQAAGTVAVPKAADAALPADVQAQLAELATLKRGQADTQKQTFDTFRTSVKGEVDKALEADVRSLMTARIPANAAISDYTKNSIVRDVLKEVESLAASNAAHKSIYERALRGAPRDAAGTKTIVDLERAYAKEIFPRILSRLLTQNTTSITSQNAAMRNRTNAQMNRPELQTSGGVAAPSRPDAKAKAREIDLEFRKTGKRLSDMELVDKVLAETSA